MTTVNAARIAAAGILTLLLSLVAVPSTSAYDRQNAVLLANNMIERCFNDGGEPDVTASEDTIFVYCRMPKGQPVGDLCDFWPGPPKCQLLPDLGDARGEIPTDNGTLNGGATQPAGTILAPDLGNGNGSLSARSAQQDDERRRDHKSRKHKGHDRRHGKR